MAGTHFGIGLVRKQITGYRNALAEAGKDPASGRTSVNRIVVLAEDAEQALGRRGGIDREAAAQVRGHEDVRRGRRVGRSRARRPRCTPTSRCGHVPRRDT